MAEKSKPVVPEKRTTTTTLDREGKRPAPATISDAFRGAGLASQKTTAGIPAAKNLPGGGSKLPINTRAAFIDNLPPPPTPPPRVNQPQKPSGPVSAGHLLNRELQPPGHRPTDPPPRGMIVDEPRKSEAKAPAPNKLPAKERPVIHNLDPAVYGDDTLILQKSREEGNQESYQAMTPGGEYVAKVVIIRRPKAAKA